MPISARGPHINRRYGIHSPSEGAEEYHKAFDSFRDFRLCFGSVNFLAVQVSVAKVIRLNRYQRLFREGIRRGIPRCVAGPLAKYIADRAHPGEFVASIACNDLLGAVLVSNMKQEQSIGVVVRFMRDFAPYESFGSKEKFKNWMQWN